MILRLTFCVVTLSVSLPAFADDSCGALAQLPSEEQSLTARKASLAAEKTQLEADIKAFNGSCAQSSDPPCRSQRDALAERQRALNARIQQWQADKTSFEQRKTDLEARCVKPDCAQYEDQLKRDKTAIETQAKVNESMLEELEKWTEANKAAEDAALWEGIKLLFGQVGEALEKQESSARALKGWLTRYDRLLRSRKVPIEALLPKIEDTLAKFVRARGAVASGLALKGTGLAMDLWDEVKNEAALIADLQMKANTSVRLVLEDANLKKFLADNDIEDVRREFALSTVDLIIESDALKKIPGLDILSFAVQYGYDAKKWLESRQRILQLVGCDRFAKLAGCKDQDLSAIERDLKAILALKKQIECTEGRLKDCRGGAAPRACPH